MMKVLCTRAADCESGATAMEYALTAAIISVALLTGAETLGSVIDDQFNLMSNKLASTSGQQAQPGGNTSLVSLQIPGKAKILTVSADTRP
ncbi:Flp family type IVb pilin [Hoeflea sp.]|uniref:Flp family type IVb pilin n=1 Tax=Hoeflea sp. TaxID=1940281 RepID=UPI003A91E37E